MFGLILASALAFSSPAPTNPTPTLVQKTQMLCVAGYDADCPDSSARLTFDVPEGAIGYRGSATAVTDNEAQREECAVVSGAGSESTSVCTSDGSPTKVWTEPIKSASLTLLVRHLSASEFPDPGSCPWDETKPWLYRMGNACTPGSMHVIVTVTFLFPETPTTTTTTLPRPTDTATVIVTQTPTTTTTTEAPSPEPEPTIGDPLTLPETGGDLSPVPYAAVLIVVGAILTVQARRHAS